MDSRFWYKRRIRWPDKVVPNIEAGNAVDWGSHKSPNLSLLRQARSLLHDRGWRRIQRKRPPDKDMFTLATQGTVTPFAPEVFAGDILHLHWVTNWLDYDSFFSSIPDDFPLVCPQPEINTGRIR